MINLFQTATDDKSLVYLSQIFGTMNGIINSPEGGGTGSSVNLLSVMFTAFNSVILAIGALIILYVTVAGVMKTAHEGEFLGKQWNSIWLPIRMVLGIAALVPTSSGFSSLQILMMWIIVQGIGAADMLWTTVLGYVNLAGSPYPALSLPSAGVTNSMGQLFQALVCDATAQLPYANPTPGSTQGNYYCATKGDYCATGSGGSVNPFSSSSNPYSMGPNGSCGILTYCNPTSVCTAKGANSLECATCTQQVASLAQIIPVLQAVAYQVALSDYYYRDFYANSYTNQTNNPNWALVQQYCSKKNISQCCVPSPVPSSSSSSSSSQACTSTSSFPKPDNSDGSGPSNEGVNLIIWPFISTTFQDFLTPSVNLYMNGINTAVNTVVGSEVQQNAINGPLQSAANTGWILAGSYYYTISEMNSTRLSLPTLTINTQNPNSDKGIAMNGFRTDYDAAQTIINDATNAATTASDGSNAAGSSGPSAGDGSSGGMASVLSGLTNAISSAMGSIANAFFSSFCQNSGLTSGLTGNGSSNSQVCGSPLVALQLWGQMVLLTVEIMYPILLGITFILGMAGYIDVFALGTGVTNPIGPTVTMIYFLIVPPLFVLLGLLVTFGGLIAVYVPLIPYVVFTVGAIGWLLSTIEAMVAAPLVALGIMTPTNHGHELLGKAEHAVLIIFNIFLRPSLMIFGLIAAMLMASVSVLMINATFQPVMANIMGMAGNATAGVAVAAAVVSPIALIGLTNILEFIIFLFAYVMFIIAVLNKCFSAIYVIPENVITWIGGQAQRHGEEGVLGKVEAGVSEGKGQIGKGMEGVRSTGDTAGEKKRGAQKQADKAQKNKDAASKGGPSATGSK